MKRSYLRGLIPLFSLIWNFSFLAGLEIIVSNIVPNKFLPFSHFMRMVFIFILYLMFLYTSSGQALMVWVAKGRKMIGREEIKIQGLVEQLKDQTNIQGFNSPILYQYKLIQICNILTFGMSKSLKDKLTSLRKMYSTGAVKIFTFDNLDIDSMSFGNSIIFSKGAIDSLTENEMKSLIYNEIMQVKYNISAKRLLHQGLIFLARVSCVLSVLLFPMNLMISILNKTGDLKDINTSTGTVVLVFIISLLRLIVWIKSEGFFTNIFYQFYEAVIFGEADRATHGMGIEYSKGMLTYLEKLYIFKIEKSYARMQNKRLFSDVKPLVAYRINYYDSVLGNNRNLNQLNLNWSSNYIKHI